MDKSGQAWTIQEAITLYSLIISGSNVDKAQKIMGRSALAIEYKVIDGGLFDTDLNPVHPFPCLIDFLVQLRKKRKLPHEKIPPHLSAGKLSKVFKRMAKNYYGVHSIAVNKRHLIPALGKLECRDKYESAKPWWKFSSDAQSNPYIRQQTYKKSGGRCAFCNNILSEGEFQAHHSCYDHICTFDKTISAINAKNKKVRIPDCRTCHESNPERFNECLSRLHAVHGACNKRLYELEK